MPLLRASRRALGVLLSLALFACGTPPRTDAGNSDATAPLDVAAMPEAAVADAGPEVQDPPGRLRVLVEPSDMGAALVSAITSARRSVHLTVYLLSLNGVVDALIARRRAGLDVRVILNQNFPPNGGDNTQSYNTLRAAGVNVVWASPSFMFTHEKCLLIDATQAWIMTMNATFTSVTMNREYLLIDEVPEDVAALEALFSADFGRTTPPAYAGPLVIAPVNARAQLESLAMSAQRGIDVEAELWSDQSLTDELATVASRGVPVRVLLSDNPLSNAQMLALNALRSAGVQVRQLATPYQHAKLMIVDAARAYVGSVNFSTVSLDMNREVGRIVDDPTVLATLRSTFEADWNAGR